MSRADAEFQLQFRGGTSRHLYVESAVVTLVHMQANVRNHEALLLSEDRRTGIGTIIVNEEPAFRCETRRIVMVILDKWNT